VSGPIWRANHFNMPNRTPPHSIVGLRKSRRVVVVPPDPAWPERFEQIASDVRGALACPIVALHHIGSTSVPGLAAKPIIDLLLEVERVEALDEEHEGLSAIGFAAWGENGIPGRRYFTKELAGERVAHLHAFAAGDAGLTRHLAFRDYLRAHPAIAAEYGQLKERVAASCNNDIEAYVDGKNAFIQHHEAEALQWWAERREG
jgi:GrpB-like predicted nucleotidyltransferase (UPF0157 family)